MTSFTITAAIVVAFAIVSLVVARVIEPFLTRRLYPIMSDDGNGRAWLRFPAAIALGAAAVVVFGLLAGCSSRECNCRCWHPSAAELAELAPEPEPEPEQPIEGVDQAELDAFYETIDDSLRSLELIKRTVDGMISEVESR